MANYQTLEQGDWFTARRAFFNGLLVTILLVAATSHLLYAQSGVWDGRRIAMGNDFAHVGVENETSLSWGNSSAGQTCNGSTTPLNQPAPTNSLNSLASKCSLGFAFGGSITNQGHVRLWGNNTSGQVGASGVTHSASGVVHIFSTNPAVSLAAGHSHCYLLRADGSVMSRGLNTFGQLGVPAAPTSGSFFWEFVTISAGVPLSGIFKIAAGDNHGFALGGSPFNPTVYCWGNNLDGQLGLTGQTLYGTATINTALASGGHWPVDLDGGAQHSIVLMSDNTVRCMGSHVFGNIGTGIVNSSLYYTTPQTVVRMPTLTPLQDIVSVCAGTNHNLALDIYGRVWAWGRNDFGQLGLGTNIFHQTAANLIPGLQNIRAIAAGGNSSMAMRSDGAIFVWGKNNKGQLGLGTIDNLAHGTPQLVVLCLYPSSLENTLAVEALGSSTFAMSLTCDTNRAGQTYATVYSLEPQNGGSGANWFGLSISPSSLNQHVDLANSGYAPVLGQLNAIGSAMALDPNASWIATMLGLPIHAVSIAIEPLTNAVTEVSNVCVYTF